TTRNVFFHQCQRSGRGKSRQGFRVEFTGKNITSRRMLLRFRPGARLVQRRDDFGRAVCQGRDDRRRGEQHIEHDRHLAFEPLVVELFLAVEYMHFVFERHVHVAAPPELRRRNMPWPCMDITSSPFWLKTSHRLLTMPMSGLLFDARVSSVVRRALMVSPGRTGLSHLRFSMPGEPTLAACAR